MSLSRFSLQRAMRAAFLMSSGFLATGLQAHQCGPTEIQLAPGEVFLWQITADLTEVLTDYTPLDTGNPNVAILSPTAPFSAHNGVFSIIATGFGKTTFKVRDLSDAIAVLRYLFLDSAALPCLKAADVDDSGSIQVTDAIVLLNWLFLGGPDPPGPFGACGEDPTADSLACDGFPAC